MLSLVILVIKLCIHYLHCVVMGFHKFADSLSRRIYFRVLAKNAKHQLILAQLSNLSSKSEDEQLEILKGIDVNSYIRNGPSRKLKLYAGYTCLHFSVEKGDLDLTNKLINLGANLFKQEYSNKLTPLHLAINNAFVIENQICDLEGKQRKLPLVDMLLSVQVKKKSSRNPTCSYGISHLHIACIVNHTDAVKFFIKNGNSINQATNVSSRNTFHKYTALHFAVRYSAIETIDILLSHGADMHLQDTEGISPLHLLVKRLIDVNDFIRIGKRALIAPYECEMRRLELITKLFLVNRRLNINIDFISSVAWKISRTSYFDFVDDTGLSSLHVACIMGDTSAAEYFLKWYDNVNLPVRSNSKLWSGWTPLHFAACCNPETFKLLLHRGADISLKNREDKTPLDLCLQRFNPDVIHSILSTKDELSSIRLSDGHTTLSDFLLASNDIIKFEAFLQNLIDFNISISLDSPVWSGRTIMHLVTLMNEKSKSWKEFEKKTNYQEDLDSLPALYNCTEEENEIYPYRIELCLIKNCSLTIKDADGRTPLHHAFRMHKINVVKAFLEKCQDNETDSDGLSHFHIACAIGNVRLIKRFIDNGVDINHPVRNKFQCYFKSELVAVKAKSSPLHIAVTFKHTDVISYLLEKGADVYSKDSTDSTPIHLTKKLNYRSIARLLLNRIPNLQESLSKDQMSHLEVVVYADVETAMRNLVNINSISQSNYKNLQCLALASNSKKVYRSLLKISSKYQAYCGLLNVSLPIALPFVRQLKRQKWRNVKAPLESTCGVTLLHFACSKLDTKWSRILLRKGADANAKIRRGSFVGHTPLYRLIDEVAWYAANDPRNLMNIVELLIKHGADVTIQSQGQTPVHRLSYLLSDYETEFNEQDEFLLPIVDLMLRNQRDYSVNPSDHHGFTHFHYACARNLVEVVEAFLDHGAADVNQMTYPFSTSNGGFTPLQFAVAYRSREVAELLLKRGANARDRDAKGNTPLHTAVKAYFPFIETLLSYGAEINATNVMSETPMECLLKLVDYTLDHVDAFLNLNGSIKFRNTDLNTEGTLGLAMAFALSSDRQAIMKRLIEFSSVMKTAVENGFNAILSAVKVHVTDELTVDDYVDLFEQLIDIGCEIDQRTKDGMTALHGAVFMVNVEAVEALLQFGVDLKLDNRSPPLFLNTMDDENMFRFNNMLTSFALHVWKMKYVGFDESEWKPISNQKLLRNHLFVNNVEQNCQSEMIKAANTNITRTLNLESFLSELRGQVEYPLLLPHRRRLVDDFFKRSAYLRREFPEFCGLLLYRYKKSVQRLELWKPAKNAFVSIYPYLLPDLCTEHILKYLKNDDLKVLIKTEEVVNAY